LRITIGRRRLDSIIRIEIKSQDLKTRVERRHPCLRFAAGASRCGQYARAPPAGMSAPVKKKPLRVSHPRRGLQVGREKPTVSGREISVPKSCRTCSSNGGQARRPGLLSYSLLVEHLPRQRIQHWIVRHAEHHVRDRAGWTRR